MMVRQARSMTEGSEPRQNLPGTDRTADVATPESPETDGAGSLADDVGGSERSAYSIRAAERVCDLIELAQQRRDGFSLNDVIDAVGLPRSSAFRYLVTLEERSFIIRDAASGRYQAGPRLQPVTQQQLDQLIERVRPVLIELRDEFEETASIAALDGTRITYALTVESQKPTRWAGPKHDHELLHCTAVGKVIATMLPPSRVREILNAEGMQARTDKTITDIDEFFQEVGATRSRGYGINDSENDPDARCVAVPLSLLPVPTALSLSAPSFRFSPERMEEAALALQQAVARLAMDVATG